MAEENARHGSGRLRFPPQGPGIIPRSEVGNGRYVHSDDSFTQRFSSLYLPFDCCSLPVVGSRVDRDNGSANPDWIAPIWRRINLLLLTIVSIGVAAILSFARGRSLDSALDLAEGGVAAGIWFFALGNRSRSPSVPPANSSHLAAQVMSSGAITAIAMMIFATLIMPRIDSANRHRSREVAGAIRAVLPVGAHPWVLEDSYRPFWYYLEPEVRYFHGVSDLPPQSVISCYPLRAEAFVQNPIWQNAPPD